MALPWSGKAGFQSSSGERLHFRKQIEGNPGVPHAAQFLLLLYLNFPKISGKIPYQIHGKFVYCEINRNEKYRS